jgi:aminoglycoside 3-N-acetyltransferase
MASPTPHRPTVTREQLRADLGRLGVQPADVLLVHSSLSSLGYVRGGADTVIDALLDAVGPAGTVMFPTLTGSRNLGPDCPPRFDPRADPCWTGQIPDTAWRKHDAVRSLHPTHSVAAIGPHAHQLTDAHELAGWPCGPGTPYYKHTEIGGKILLIGCDLSVATTLHGVEEELNLPYHLQPTPVRAAILAPAGPISLTTRIHLYGPERCFPRLEPLLIQSEVLIIGRVGSATSRLIDATAMLRIARRAAKQNPEFFLSDHERGLGWGDGSHPRLIRLRPRPPSGQPDPGQPRSPERNDHGRFWT